MTWSVTCPNKKDPKHKNTLTGWSLSAKELIKIGNDCFKKNIECRVCAFRFSLQEGVQKAFASDNVFAVHDFQFNSQEIGNIKIKIGQLKRIQFKKQFEDKPQVYLTPYLKPVHTVPGYISKKGFSIFTSNSKTIGETREISWFAIGNRKQKGIPIWRKLLSNSKDHQLRKDFQSEIVYLESAFEVFIGAFLWEKLTKILNNEAIEWILKLGIDQKLKIGFTILTGKPLSKLFKDQYINWKNDVYLKRNNVIHKGIEISTEEARKARESLFDLITKIEPNVLNYFRIQRI